MVSNPRQMQNAIQYKLFAVDGLQFSVGLLTIWLKKVTVTDCYQRILQARSRIMNYYGSYI